MSSSPDTSKIFNLIKLIKNTEISIIKSKNQEGSVEIPLTGEIFSLGRDDRCDAFARDLRLAFSSPEFVAGISERERETQRIESNYLLD